MELQQSTNVYTSDGKEAGSLNRVVIEPETHKVTHIVIKSGLIIKDDKVVPVSNVDFADHNRVNLNCSSEELKGMSPLKIDVQVSNDGSGRGESYDPVTGGMSVSTPYITEKQRTIPEELIALKEGAPVISDDDKHVGNIESVLTEPETTTVTYFVVSQGLLSKTRKSIPIQWVSTLDDEKVSLNIEAQEYENLPPAQEQQSS